MSTILPPFIALKSASHDTYLSYDSDSDHQSFGRIQFNGGNVFSPLAKFEVVTAYTGIGLVHIRCCHNKKFLRLLTSGGFFISPEADEPVEDQSSWMSTLFEPTLVDGDRNRIRLALLRLNQALYTAADQLANANRKPFKASGHLPSAEIGELYNFVDLESLILLPKHVAFKDGDGNYLTLAGVEEPRLQFVSTEKGDPKSWFVVSTDGHDGSARIMSYDNKQFWRYNSADHSIWVDTLNPTAAATTAQSTSFLPIKVERNVISLRSFGNNNLCGPFQSSSLSAAYHTIVRDSRLVMEEFVLSRSIYNVNYDLANAVIYGETPFNNFPITFVENRGATESNYESQLVFTGTRSSTWTPNNSSMVGVSSSVSFKIPFIDSTGINISAEYSGSYTWGETLTTESTVEIRYSFVVPPHTTLIIRLMATKGSCDVPFSYYQRDVLYNGKTEIYSKDDGLYTGTNIYNLRYQIAQSRLDSSRTDQRSGTIYWEQKVPMPFDAAITQLQPSLENKATQEQSLEGVPVPLPLEETPREQKVQLPLEETVDEVAPVSVT